MAPKKTSKQNAAANKQEAASNGKSRNSENIAVDLLHQQHEELKSKADQLAAAKPKMRRAVKELYALWRRHCQLYRQVMFPMLEQGGVEPEALRLADVESDIIETLFVYLARHDPHDEMYDAVATVLDRSIAQLIKSEAHAQSGLIARAKAAEIDLKALGQSMQSWITARDAKHRGREQQGSSEGERESEVGDEAGSPAEVAVPLPSPRFLRGVGTNSNDEENDMPGYDRPRDEHGRFVEEGSRRQGQRMRNYDDDDDRRSRSRGDDDDERGWHGESRRHSQAAQRGWETRRGGRYDDDDDDRNMRRGRDYDDDRRGGRGRYDDDDDRRSSRSGGRGHGGWFGDSEGHAEAARRGWDNPDHGPSGWYGDSERHSQASRRGWDNPDHGPSGWYGDRERHAQASRRGWDNPDHGPSGWYGDSRGHSEASRRGWDERYDEDRSSRRRSSRRRDDY